MGMKPTPIRHHYIPQFLLRQFCEDEGKTVLYYDKKEQKFYHKRTQDIFMGRRLYEDEVNHPDNPMQVEDDLGALESDAAKVIRLMRRK